MVQPLVRIYDGAVAGYEALGRVVDDCGCGPAQWLEAAEAYEVRDELELAFLRAAAALGPPPGGLPLFVNVSAATLLDPRFEAIRASLPAHVLELSEHDRIEDYAQLLPRLRAWQAQGTLVAVDDVGAGYANMASVLQLRPAYVKIDRSLVNGLDRDARRRAVVTALHTLASSSGALSVAEGVERPEELAVLRDLGIDLAQGYLLARPGECWPVPGVLAQATAPAALDVRGAADAHVLAQRVIAAFSSDPQLLPSIYLARGGQLRCIARHGQSLVLDGIEAGMGLTGTAYARGLEVLVPDVTVDPRYRQAVPGVLSEMAVPLRVGDRVVGVFNVDALRRITEADIADVRRAARALEERLAVVGVGEENDSVLLRLGRVIPSVTQSQSLRELAKLSVRAALEVGGFDTAGLWAVDGASTVLVDASGTDHELLRSLDDAVVGSMRELVEAMASCYSGGQDLDLVSGPTVALSSAGVRALCAVPLRDGRRLVGFILVTRRTGGSAVPGEVVQAMELLGLQIGSRSAALAVVAELEHNASRDPLTGIANRVLLDAVLDDPLAAAPLAGGWLAVIDLDRFKEVNDQWGHSAGDEVLRAVADVVDTMAGDTLAVRLGGDEFAFVLRPSEPDEAVATCEEVRRRTHVLLQPYGADVSIGLARIADEHGVRAALVHADEALYLRKHIGGAGVTAWSADDTRPPAQRPPIPLGERRRRR
ncbi:MAG: cdpA 2 [Frankiales bacterium]|nr:cdpA 2 [Frankiales bacterium]